MGTLTFFFHFLIILIGLTTIIGSTAMNSELICVSVYDVLLLTANFNQLISDVHDIEKNVNNSKSNKEINLSPIFDVVKVDGCFKLKLDADYANIFGDSVQEFITNDLIDGINPLVERDEKTKRCPNKKDAYRLIAVNLCEVGCSFSDQLVKAQNITNKILQNSMEQIKAVRDKLRSKYKKLYKKLVENGYEKQLKNAIILKAIASHNYRVKLCENEFHATTKPREPLGALQENGTKTFQPTSSVLEDEKKVTWDKYVKDFGRNFETIKDVTSSAKCFKDSKRDINTHNADYKEGKTSYYLKYTKYSDQKDCPKGKQKGHPKTNNKANGITSEEIFRLTKGGGKRRPKGDPNPPPSIDWRTFGAVTSVPDQGRICGACYAFGTTVCLEYLHFKTTNKLEALSKQQYIDCTKPPDFYCFACTSGFPDEVFNYLSKGKHGIMLESDYPYTASEGKHCKYNKSKTVLRIGGWKYASCDFYPTCPQNDEASMQRAVASKGPISVCVYAGCPKFKNYGGGVFDDKCCEGKTSSDTDHVMAIVGYGTDPKKGDYWICKNSYGPEWGENGYIRLKRGVNHCAVATEALYATT